VTSNRTKIKPEKHRRSKQGQSLAYQTLEKRSLLAGMVFVDLVGPNLNIIGDLASNEFTVNLNATTTDELIIPQGETGVRFSNDFNRSVDLTNLRDVRIYAGSGHDVVTINGSGTFAKDDLIVSLGHGDDSLYVVGNQQEAFTLSDDARIFGMSGHDSIFFSNVEIGDDFRLAAGAGTDVVALNQVSIGGNAFIWTQFGHDSILTNATDISGKTRIKLGAGADRLNSVSTQWGSRLNVVGGQGWDKTMFDDANTTEQRRRFRSIDRQVDQLNHCGDSQRAIDQLKQAFFEWAGQMDPVTADLLHDGLIELSSAHDADLIQLDLDAQTQTVSAEDPTPTVSVLWDQAVQEAVTKTSPGPTIGSRAHAMVHTAMFDAWSAYDLTASSTQLGDRLQRPASENTDANKIEAMSYAAYRVLDDLFESQTEIFDLTMAELGFDPANTSTDVTTAAGIGNRMAQALLEFRHNDGSNQLGNAPDGTPGVPYSDTTGYQPANNVGDPAIIDAWTPEYVPIDAEPGTEDRIQEFLTPHWSEVTPFGFSSGDQFRPAAPQPFLLVDGTVDLDAKTITLADGTVLDIDKSLIGTVINPEFIAQSEEVVEISANLTDEQKLIAEFWEDGEGTSFPPGTFMTFGQFVSARDNNTVDEDAALFFALGNAVFDAGITTWESKTVYDYVRPVRAIRDLGELGLIGEFDASLGGYAIDAWTPSGSTQTILATDFLTYQTPGGDPSPPFAEYTSGHSGFSAAAAKILELFTGSDEFGGSVTFEPGESRFEPGMTPTEPVTLAWETFGEAADEAGLSRLYGGIHFTEGDINGRQLGDEVAMSVWDRVQFFVNGGSA
jgi:hypothetical protein